MTAHHYYCERGVLDPLGVGVYEMDNIILMVAYRERAGAGGQMCSPIVAHEGAILEYIKSSLSTGVVDIPATRGDNDIGSWKLLYSKRAVRKQYRKAHHAHAPHTTTTQV